MRATVVPLSSPTVESATACFFEVEVKRREWRVGRLKLSPSPYILVDLDVMRMRVGEETATAATETTGAGY